MPRPVLLLLGLVFGTALAVHDSVLDVASFTGFRVYRVLPTSEEELQLLDSLQASPYYDFWTEVRQTYQIFKNLCRKLAKDFCDRNWRILTEENLLAVLSSLYSNTVVEWIFLN